MSEFPAEYIAKVPKRILKLLPEQDSATKVRAALRRNFTPRQVAGETEQRRGWELCGVYYLQMGRLFEAIAIFEALYAHMMLQQAKAKRRIHKGVPLFWRYECHRQLGQPLLAKRYLMLSLTEDGVTDHGIIIPQKTGTYHRCVWNGMPEEKFVEYAQQVWNLFQEHRREGRFPEWLLQEVDQDWMTEHPTPAESVLCPINEYYVRFLLKQLGQSQGKSLERLAHYLLSCIPGCRARMRMRSKSTDYDVLGVLEGAFADFRSEIGRYFVCECKDWSSPADFSSLAKFCRVLDSTKTKFGILFSKHGVTGRGRSTDAERELLKMFQDRGVVIVVVTEADLQLVSRGTSFITTLRQKYEQVRFDLSIGAAKPTK